MKSMFLLILLLAICSSLSYAEAGEKHLFILSGQSNMARLNPAPTFKPALQKAFGDDNFVIVKNAHSGQPIRRWVKGWKSASGETLEETGDLYLELMEAVKEATKGAEFETVTFLWMQGERDAREQHGSVYAASFAQLVKQLSDDLKRDDINVVIGRLSDFGGSGRGKETYPDWPIVREAQVKMAEAHPHYEWVDTDDLNDGLNGHGKEIKNDLHYSVKGYETLGERFAEKAIALINARLETSK